MKPVKTMPRSPRTLAIILMAAGFAYAAIGHRSACAVPVAGGVSLEDPACSADIDGDLMIDGADLLRVLAAWGECTESDCPADFDGDGLVGGFDLTVLLSAWGPVAADCPGGPTPEEPFHMPTMTDASSLDIIVVEDWHRDSIDGSTQQKLIDIHVDEWWEGVDIRVRVRLIVPFEERVAGFIVTGSGLNEHPGDDESLSVPQRVALDAGVGVVTTKIRSLGYYPDLVPHVGELRTLFGSTLDWRYTELYLWGAIMMRTITAAFDDELFEPGPVIAYGNSKNGMTPLVAAIHDDRVTAVRSTHAYTTYTPIRAHDPDAVAEVEAANQEFLAAYDDLPDGDQHWSYYTKGFQNLIDAVAPYGWTATEVRSALDAVADDLYVSENRAELAKRGVEIFSLPGSHDWVAYDVPGTSTRLPGLRTYIVPNGGHAREGHFMAPSNDVDAAFFAEQLAGADRGLETPQISAEVEGDVLEVTVTFPEGGVPETSHVFWMYDRGPDGSAWYLYELFPESNWAEMSGSGSTWTASIELEPGRSTIDIVTAHTVTVDGRAVPISAPYTRVAIK